MYWHGLFSFGIKNWDGRTPMCFKDRLVLVWSCTCTMVAAWKLLSLLLFWLCVLFLPFKHCDYMSYWLCKLWRFGWWNLSCIMIYLCCIFEYMYLYVSFFFSIFLRAVRRDFLLIATLAVIILASLSAILDVENITEYVCIAVYLAVIWGLVMTYTVRCCYNAVILFLNPYKRHGRAMGGCLLWVWSLIYVLLLSSQYRWWYQENWTML